MGQELLLEVFLRLMLLEELQRVGAGWGANSHLAHKYCTPNENCTTSS